MALVVNSNIASLNAQRQLNSSTQALDQASERLASGQRINSAADDAAGLAISNRQTSQIRGLDQAIRNANDGSSLIQTAEGALQESTNILQRMRELSVQSSNGIYSDSDRNTLDAEVQQLVQELDRISETTSFNGQNILDGSAGKIDLQIGANAGQTISFEIAETSTKSLGLGSTSGDLTGDNISATLSIDEGDIQINGQALGAIDLAATGSNLDDVISDINNNVEGVTASASNVFEAATAGTGVLGAGEEFTIAVGSIDGSDATTFTVGSDDANDNISTTNINELADLINEQTGGAVTASVSSENKLILSNSTGGSITVAETAPGDLAGTGFTNGAAQQGAISLTSDDGGEITITRGAEGTSADLEAFGFQETRAQGEVLGGATGDTVDAQTVDFTTALVVNDLKINGTSISVEGADNLQTKVDNINKASAETGVVASVSAQATYDLNLSSNAAVITSTTTGQDFAALDALGAGAGEILINGNTIDIAGAADGSEVAALLNAESANTGVTASVLDDGQIQLFSENTIVVSELDAGTVQLSGLINTADLSGANADSTTGAATAVATEISTTGALNVNGTDVTIDVTSSETVLSSFNDVSGTTGVRASIDDNGQLALSSNSTITLDLAGAAADDSLAVANALGITFSDSVGSDNLLDPTVVNSGIKLDSVSGQTIQVETTDNGAAATGLRSVNSDLSSVETGTAISSISISTVSGAQAAIGSIDTALETINDTRSQLGAVSNRLDFTVSNLSNVSENTSAARSRVVDADFAAETAALSRAQVLQQASQSILAQANARPQQVLSLLQ